MKTEGCCYFRLVDLYINHLEQMNVSASSVHHTKLEEQILLHISEPEAYNKGKETWLAYKQNVRAALATAFPYNDALTLVKANIIMRTQILEHKCEFTDLTKEPQKEAVSSSLLKFVSVLPNGGDGKCGHDSPHWLSKHEENRLA